MQTLASVDPLIEQLRQAVRLQHVPAIANRIREVLESFIPDDGLAFPQRFRQIKAEGYARRLLHRDSELGFTALVMTWGPQQRTPLHDHAGIWCVEGVLEGEIDVERYELQEEVEPGVFRFAPGERLRATAGTAGALIPPLEHHVLGNPYADRLALTLHVYGGEMDHCTIFEPAGSGEGLYRAHRKPLSYDE